MSRAATILAREFAALGYDVAASLRAGRAVRISANGVKRSTRAALGIYDSKWEAQRAQLLSLKKSGGLILDYEHHPAPFPLPDGGRYTADFRVVLLDSSVEYEEIKGYWRADSGSRKRFTMAAALHPQYRFRVWTLQRGEWVNIETRNGR
jgi:hypothetical protein